MNLRRMACPPWRIVVFVCLCASGCASSSPAPSLPPSALPPGLGTQEYALKSSPASQPAALRSATPDAVGLTWRECALSGGYDPQDARQCFDQSAPSWYKDEREAGNFGKRLANDNFQLTIGADTYRTTSLDGLLPNQECHTLWRGETALKTLCGQFTSHSTNILLQNIDGKAAWEFADHRLDTVIYDGRDLRDRFQIDAAYRPYQLQNQLIFVGKKDGKYFVVYDGQRVGPDFDEIVIAYCCEPVLWSVQYGQGRYVFWGSRNGQQYVVEVSALRR